jgi:hypothetical protein
MYVLARRVPALLYDREATVDVWGITNGVLGLGRTATMVSIT